MMRFWVGETARVKAEFTDDAGAPVVAVGVAFTARSPTGKNVIGSPVGLNTTGAFYADFVVDEPGVWAVRASCTGPTAAAVEDQFEGRASYVLPAQ